MMVGTYATAHEIGLPLLSQEQIVNAVATMPVSGTIALLGTLHEFIDSAAWRANINFGIRQIGPSGKWTIEQMMAAQKWLLEGAFPERRMFIAHGQISALQRLVLMHGRQDDDSTPTADQIATTILCLFNCSRSASPELEGGMPVRDWLFGIPVQSGNRLLRVGTPRAWTMYVDIASQLATSRPNGLELDVLMRSATGLSVDEYVRYGFFLRSGFRARLLEGRAPIVDIDYLMRAGVPAMQNRKLLKALTMTATTGPKQFRTSTSPTVEFRDVDAFTRFPVFATDSQLIQLVPDALESRITEIGVYYELLGAAYNTGCVEQFRQVNGEIQERYLRHIASTASSPPLPRGIGTTRTPWVAGDEPYGKSLGKKLPDLIISGLESLVVGETTTKTMTADARIEADPAKIKADLEGLLYRKIRQLAARIGDMGRGEVEAFDVNAYSTIWPLIVVSALPPAVPGFLTSLREYANQHMPSDLPVAPLCVLAVHEFEILMAVADQFPGGLDAVLASRTSDRWYDLDFSNWLVDGFQGPTDSHRALAAVFDDLMRAWKRALEDHASQSND